MLTILQLTVWPFIKTFWKPIACILTVLFVVWGLEHHGFNRGRAKEKKVYDASIAAAKKQNADLEIQLATANKTLAGKFERIGATREKDLLNEKAAADRLIADLRTRMSNVSAGACVPDPSTSARCVDVAAAAIQSALSNYDAARRNAAQVDGLQVYIGEALKLSGNKIPPDTKSAVDAANKRLDESSK